MAKRFSLEDLQLPENAGQWRKPTGYMNAAKDAADLGAMASKAAAPAGGSGLMSALGGPGGVAVSAGLDVVGGVADYLQADADKRNNQRLANSAESEQRQLDREALNYVKGQNETEQKRRGLKYLEELATQSQAAGKKRSGRDVIMKAVGWY